MIAIAEELSDPAQTVICKLLRQNHRDLAGVGKLIGIASKRPTARLLHALHRNAIGIGYDLLDFGYPDHFACHPYLAQTFCHAR